MRLPRALRHAESTVVAVFGAVAGSAAIVHGWVWQGLLYGGFVLFLSWLQRGCETVMGERRDSTNADGELTLDDPYTTAYGEAQPLPEHQEHP